MDIQYELTVDDYVAFADYHHAHSSITGGTVRRSRYGIAVAWVVVALLDAATNGLGIDTVIWASGALLWFALWPLVHRRLVRRNMHRFATQGLTRGSIGHHTLSLATDGLTDRTSFSEYRTFWQGIDRIATTSTHLYVYVGPNAAHVIPRRAFTNAGAETAFLNAVEHLSADAAA